MKRHAVGVPFHSHKIVFVKKHVGFIAFATLIFAYFRKIFAEDL